MCAVLLCIVLSCCLNIESVCFQMYEKKSSRISISCDSSAIFLFCDFFSSNRVTFSQILNLQWVIKAKNKYCNQYQTQINYIGTIYSIICIWHQCRQIWKNNNWTTMYWHRQIENQLFVNLIGIMLFHYNRMPCISTDTR